MEIVRQSVELLNITENPEQLIEGAGRTCYKSEELITDKSASDFVDKITDRGHHSVIEHANASFRIICDRGITHEIVRHRLASYSQESTRYVRYGDIEVLEPSNLLSPENVKIWEEACQKAEMYYGQLLKNGVKPEIARSVLPTCLKTEIVMTCNFREWMHFIKLRASLAAHPDIRPIACQIWEILMQHAPSVFKHVRPPQHKA